MYYVTIIILPHPHPTINGQWVALKPVFILFTLLVMFHCLDILNNG